MRSKRRLAAVLLVVAMILGTTSTVMATTAPVLTDIGGNQAEADIRYLVGLGILHGHPDGTFRPNTNLRRSEAVKIIILARHGNDHAARPLFGTSPFRDVPGTHWASGFIALARNLGIVEGRGAGIFDPEAWVTYAEFAKMLVEATGLRSISGFGWPANYVEAARAAGIVTAAELPGFVAGTPATRGDAAIMATNAVADVPSPATGFTLARSVFGQVAPAVMPRRGGTLRVAIIGNPPTLDVMRTTATVTLNSMWHAFEPLFTLDRNYDPIPHLVDTYVISPDNRIWTLNLRRGVRFHDGREMVADDVVASVNRFGRLTTWGRSLFEITESLVARDRYTVVLTLREPTALVPRFLSSVQSAIMPRDVIDEAGDGTLTRFIGTGPFRFVEFEPDRHIRFDRFADYSALPGGPNGYGGTRTAFVDRILFIPVPDTAVRIAGVQMGEHHFGEWITPDEYERLRVLPGIVTRIIRPSGWPTAVFNKRQGMFTDVRMRQAFLAALDMEPIMRAAYGHPDFWRLCHGIMMQEQAFFHPAGREWYNQNNPDRARELLAAAGYTGQPVRWLTTTEYPAYYTAALVAKGQLERAGFVVELQVVDWATLVARRANPAIWDVFSTAFGVTWDPVLFLALSPTWPGWYDNAQMRDLLAQLRRETDFAKRYELFGRVQALFWEDVPVIKYGDYFLLHIHGTEVMGFAAMQSNFFWNVWLERR